jgi:hypothetical protein
MRTKGDALCQETGEAAVAGVRMTGPLTTIVFLGFHRALYEHTNDAQGC